MGCADRMNVLISHGLRMHVSCILNGLNIEKNLFGR